MFEGQHVVVTGAGRGIGRELALAFAGQGAKVLVHYGHARVEAEDVVRQIEAAGGQALLVQADLARKEEAQRLVKQARELLGTVDVWINNAGASANSAEAQGLDEIERFERMLAVDVLATWICCQGAAEYMSEGGCILNLGWNHALNGAPGLVSQLYATSKGAVISMTHSLARWGTASDIVNAALFLASPAASFITGQVLVVDGGEVMQ